MFWGAEPWKVCGDGLAQILRPETFWAESVLGVGAPTAGWYSRGSLTLWSKARNQKLPTVRGPTLGGMSVRAKPELWVLPFVTLQLWGFMMEAPGVQMYGKVETTTTTTAWEKQARGESLTATCCIHLPLPNYEWTSDIFAVTAVSTCSGLEYKHVASCGTTTVGNPRAKALANTETPL